jgi:hypothetical protein
MFPFPSPLLMGTSSAAPVIVDGTQGSTNAGILAAVHFTVSGTTVTIVGQKNVASVTRLAAAFYRITFTSGLANTNYGLFGGGRFADAANDAPLLVVPCRNSTSGRNTYSTAAVDVVITDAQGTGSDPALCGIGIFDPAAVGSDYLAACSVTISGTTPTVQRQTNVASAARQSTGVYRPTFTSALGDANYSIFGSTRYADFTNDASAFFGQNRNTAQTTAMTELSVGTLAQNTGTYQNFDPGRFSMLARNSDTSPRGTLAGARFTVANPNGAGPNTITLLKSWNIASITRTAQGLFRATFTNQLSDTDYAVMGSGKWASGGNSDTLLIGLNRNSSAGRNVHSTSAADLAALGWGTAATPFDPEVADIWFLKPWLM